MSTSVVTPAAPAAVEYPSSDGKPMAENDAQALTMIYARNALAAWFAGRRDVYVSGDLLIFLVPFVVAMSAGWSCRACSRSSFSPRS